jgi:hypothetical protein
VTPLDCASPAITRPTDRPTADQKEGNHVDSLEMQQAIEQAALEEKFREARAAENARLRAEREAQEEAEKQARAEALRAQAEEELTEMLQRNFYAGNPSATAQDFDRLKGKLKDDWMLEQAKVDRTVEDAAALAASTNAEFRGVF